jgi:hypothetical protein
MLIDKQQIDEIAAVWSLLQHLPQASDEYERTFWVHMRLGELVQDDPESAWVVIHAIRNVDGSDLVLANLAAGPLEELLVFHGEEFIDRVEALAQQDQQFKKVLGAVWKNNISDAVWDRVKAVAGPTW